MIAAWKLRREWGRIRQQLRAIPERFVEPAIQRRHDAAFKRGFPSRNGSQPLREKVALLLVYQPNGIAESTLLTCAHLASQGFSPFVVSNADLSDRDQRRLAPHVWRVMERPNLGYDFGGYRDGIRQILRWGITPARLLVLNDSVWFPTLDDQTLLADLQKDDEGIAGTILRERGKIRFLESYCYSIPMRVLEMPAFSDFWERLAITSNKYKVIRRGERGFSESMVAAGIRLRPVYPYETFLEQVAQQDDDFLRRTLLYAAHTHEENEMSRQSILDAFGAPGWRDRALSHIAGTIPREQPYSAYPFAMVRLLRYPILKKSNDRVAALWRSSYLRAVLAGDLPEPPAPVYSELRCMVRNDMQ